MEGSKSYFGHPKKLDGRSTPMQGPLLGFDLLKAQAFIPPFEVIKAWSIPLLIPLRVILFQTIDVLRQLLKDLLFKLAFRLTGPEFPVDSILAELELWGWR